MGDDELIRLAGHHGVATRYEDWRGREAAVSRDTLVAVLGALGVDASTPSSVRAELARRRERARELPPTVVVRRAGGGTAGRIRAALGGHLDGGAEVEIETGTDEVLAPPRARVPTAERSFEPLDGLADVPPGWRGLRVRNGARTQYAQLLVAPDALRPPPRMWGFTAQLYSVRSAASWGLGDLRDLADLADWSGRELGAGFVLVNPLHATEPVPPVGASPYSPMSRRFPSPLYLRIEDMPEYADLPAADRERFGTLAAKLRAQEGLLDRDAVWAAKLEALETMYRRRDRDPRFEEFRRREGAALASFSTWCAISEEQEATDWRRWPSRLQGARDHGVVDAPGHQARAGFHAWLQWRLDGQLAAAQRAARDAGMPLGIVHDLAVGVPHGSADAWIYRDSCAPGMSVGAPPDEFNQRGQDWGQQPWRPGALALAGYRPFREMAAAALRHAGGIRLDHAMQVSRLWWVPEGASPADGTYVRYDRDALLGSLSWEAERFGAVVVGEDLGTVEPEVREALADSGVLGTSLLWFERDEHGRPKPPGRWRELSLATVGTHDMPPITGFVHGDHIDLRDRLGLLTRSRAEEEDDHRRQLADWLAVLHAEGLLPAEPAEVVRALADGSTAYDEEIVTALQEFLTRTPARLIGISLADAVGERRTQNQPGTVDEYPNWRVPLGDADGRPVLLDDLRTRGALRLFRRASR
ncbi:4-alpha-glucanotransferase [Actinomadura citrea]|uniref:4-alpha-glucanotransferase n=1 Tax=Actinomadura citrea TaxID=46158 RepID=A0A7Y9GIV6_9ACTN|nr:4-alpha-glucanotransferase [Actinomadura citrea]NYE16190.1 4-alpha-glucanotransferase [Actinomadura citrea]GGT81708.1 4-alpha-glucanotransferase [Actinomadura citrea]